MTYSLIIRPRRQVTVPSDLLKKWQLEEGDVLELEMGDTEVRIKPKKQSTKALISEIQAAFKQSGIAETEFQKLVKEQRKSQSKQITWV